MNCNPQYRNVGNLGDILKHGALVAIAQRLISQSSGKIAYIDTHTFRLSAPCPNPSRWHKDVHCEKEKHSLYSEYLRLEQQIIGGNDYRCSSGLMLDLLTNSGRPYTTFLSENEPDTRQLLEAQLTSEKQKNYTVLLDAVDFQALEIPTDVKTLLILVDPFGLTAELWAIVYRLLQKCMSQGIEIVAEVFTFDKTTDKVAWSDAPEGINYPRMTISNNPYHLAMYSTPLYYALVEETCEQLGWSRHS